MVEIVIDEKFVAVSLLNNTVQRMVSDMVIDMKDQIVQEIKSAAFASWLDESTDVVSCPKLMTRYVHLGSLKEEFFLCSPLVTTTKSSAIFEKVSSFTESENLLG